MNRSMLHRLKKLEKSLGINQGTRKAVIICDSDMMETFDFSQIDADCVAILPAKESEEGRVPKGFYQVNYI
jgi:hypothetical protein